MPDSAVDEPWQTWNSMTETGFDLKQYLDDQRSQGQAESEGAFTIAQDKALTKLAHFALPGPVDWVLKIVQAANAWQAESLVVSQTREATSFFFVPTKESFPHDQEIVSALTSGNLDNSNPVYMLCMALRSLVDQAELSFVLATCRAGVLGEPIYAGDDISKLQSATRKKWSHLDSEGLRLTVSHFKASESMTGRFVPFLSGYQRRDTMIAGILENKAYASATSIVLDGRRVTEPALISGIGSGPDHRAIYLAVMEDEQEQSYLYPVLRSRKKLSTPPGSLRRGSPWYILRGPAWRYLEDHLGPSLRVERLLRPRIPRTRHSINWLRDGVVVGRSTIVSKTAGSSVSLFAPAEDLRSDLSGLSVNFDDDTIAMEKAYAKQLGDSLERLQVKFRKIASQSVISRDHFEEEDDSATPDLKAGFSIYTASLLKPIEKVGRGAGRLISSGYEKLASPDARARCLVAWCELIPEELKRVRADLEAYTPNIRFREG